MKLGSGTLILAMWCSGYAMPSLAANEAREKIVEEENEDGDSLVKVQTLESSGPDGKKKQKVFRRVMRLDGQGGFVGKYREVWKSLELSPDQQAKLFVVQQKFRKSVFESDLKKERGHFELQQQLTADNLDSQKADESIEDIGSAVRDQLKSRVEFVKEMRSVLSAAQMKRLNEAIAKMGDLNDPPGLHAMQWHQKEQKNLNK